MNINCEFCSECNGSIHSSFYNLIGRKAGVFSRILYETDNWYVVPTFGCLTIGYVLLVCKHHYLSAANLPHPLFEEMLSLKQRVQNDIFTKTGKHCICFEHGVTADNYSGANSVNHVHLHLVPFSEMVWPEISKDYCLTDFVSVPNYHQLFSLWASHFPKTYLLFQDVDGSIFYKPDAIGYPSQFFRKCVAILLKKENWNWKEEIYEENLLATISLLK